MNQPSTPFRAVIIGWVGAVCLLTALASSAKAQSVSVLTWPSRHAASSAAQSPELAPYLPMLRASINRMPEASLVKLALAQAGGAGMSASEADRLNALISQRYTAIAASPLFKNVPSALGYCFAEAQPGNGQAFLYRPADSNAHTPVLVFLHGYGGSFLLYPYQLSAWFPDHIILCPAYGTDPSALPATYLNECLAAASAQLKHPLSQPTLAGISAGGFGASRLYVLRPATYRQLIVIAAYPPDDAYKAWPRSARAAFLVGAQEDYVKSGEFAAFSKVLASGSSRFQSTVIPKAGEFFMLTHPAETRRSLESWLRRTDFPARPN